MLFWFLFDFGFQKVTKIFFLIKEKSSQKGRLFLFLIPFFLEKII
jgi:hypothetical protein